MAQDIPETYKKYVIRRIINPGIYWMAKNYNSTSYEREMQQFNYLLTQNVEKIVNIEKISTGKVIAVKNEAGFHRGLVTDIFNRNTRITYSILLIDHGNIIETNNENIYRIRNKELINKKASGVQVSIKGIQPVALDLKHDRCFTNGIFERRVQGNWSACAFKYVQNLFERNPCVFVKPLKTNNNNISGEIYFIDKSEKALVSLGQKLCENGYAIFSEINSRALVNKSLQGDSDLDIMKKIPNGALCEKLKHKDISKSVSQLNKDKVRRSLTMSIELTNSDVDNHSQQNKILMECEEQSTPLLKNSTDNRKSSFSNSLVLSADTDSCSWILKEHFNSSHSSLNSVQKEAFPKSLETSSSLISNDTKVNIFRVVQRSLELYEKEKRKLKGHCQN